SRPLLALMRHAVTRRRGPVFGGNAEWCHNPGQKQTMLRSFDTSVLIVGAGPVGLTLAMELASRGVDVTVTETRRAGEPPNVKCNQVSARSMEIFRRLGLADRIRNTGLPPEYRNDVAICVSVLGTELSRIKLPSRAGRVRGEKGADGQWPCAEWGHRINQLHLEPLLFAHAGYGMNAGIADAADLAWMLAAVLDGWAEPALLDAYQAERQPITDQVSHFAFNMAKQVSQQRREISVDIERTDASGEAMRAKIGQEAYDLYVQQQCCGGVKFGDFYAASPVIAYDGAAHPVYSMGSFESSSVPGCRAPHFWLNDKRSLYDALGDGYGLIRFDQDVAVDSLVAAAKRRGVPFKVLHIDDA